MPAPSSHISLRINEEDLMLLDAKIGQHGARNRSDVVRLAIQDYLRGQPRLPEMDTIKIPLGRSCLLYTSPSPRDLSTSRMPSSA